ncbi:MAG: Nmad3 family putative nucleotide modification protein [Halobacteriota archaeon]
MKIIISRKGFDLSSGGIPSPIFSGNKIASLPIPATRSLTKIDDLNINGHKAGQLVYDLSKKCLNPQQCVHLDPDIDYKILANRPNGWKGAFGQIGTAQKHLSNNEVGVGDLFVYFGWFREVEQNNQIWRFRHDAPDLHVIYGWLFVEDVIILHEKENETINKYPWLRRHPHLHGINDINNTIYIGSQQLPPEIDANVPGYGVFHEIKDTHILTDTSQKNRSVWKLPICFYPENKPPLSYHAKTNRWAIQQNSKWVTLNSVGRGQEFVLDTKYYPGVIEWLIELFS